MDPLPGVDEDAGPVLHEVDDVPGVGEQVLVVFSGIVGQGVPDIPVQNVYFTLLKHKPDQDLSGNELTCSAWRVRSCFHQLSNLKELQKTWATF